VARFTVDHLLPRSRGGTDALENLALACRRCNERRYTLPHNSGLVTADVCYAHPWQCYARLCHVVGGVSPMRVGLWARAVVHDEQTRVMRIDAIHTEVWKTAVTTNWAAARIEGRRRGPGPWVRGA
jgi:hypothetical protein